MKYLKIILFISFITSIFLSSCRDRDTLGELLEEKLQENEATINQYVAENGLNVQTTESGLRYIIDDANGNVIPDTTFRHVSIKYEVRLLPSLSVIDTAFSLKGDTTYSFPIGAGLNLAGIEEALQKMSKGSKATLLMPYTLAYGQFNNPILPPYSPVRVDLELVDVQSENDLLIDYLDKKGYNPTSAVEGMYYIRLEAGNGKTISADSAVTVKYIGRFLDDKVFDSSTSFSLGEGGLKTTVIDGWEKGIPLMTEGEKAVLCIPSSLAYRGNGSGAILPFTPIVFEIEVIRVGSQ